MTQNSLVERHYAIDGMLSRIEKVLQDAGLTGDQLAWDKLSPVDQFLSRGMLATRENSLTDGT
jgi:hypothetical protein